METKTKETRVILTGLFCGIMATLACLAYDFAYRYYSGFEPSAIINVASIIIACTIALLLFGAAFYFLWDIKGGKFMYTTLFVLLTCFCVWKAMGVERSNDAVINVQFRWLLSGTIIIMGFCSFFLIPFLYDNESFNRHVI